MATPETSAKLRHDTRRRESGLSLLEAMIALFILAFAITATLTVYSNAWQLFSKGENALDLQQQVRLGFDKVGLDLKMTGFNHNPDGDAARPDEAIEAAFDTAVVVRADFDARDATLSATPESTLEGGAFDIVSTGNDEITAFVLAKPDGSSTDTLTFSADVEETPRDGDVETVSIPNVALVHDDPPYALYRITLNNDTNTWDSSDFFVRTLLAENVYELSFRFYDQAGSQLNSTFDLTTTSDDIGGAETASVAAQRSAIRRIELNLVGMTADPDLQWTDVTDANSTTEQHRKFQLVGEVTPRNAGMVGTQDL